MSNDQAVRSRRPFVAISVAWAGALALVALVSANCSIDHRSQEFSCVTTADCTDGRTCSAGFCIGGNGSGSNVRDAGVIDSSSLDGNISPPVDAATCPAICTSCDAALRTCEIDCSVTDACVNNGPVACPPGYTCQIDCSINGSCRAVNCAGAKSCQIECSGDNSCRQVTCGSGPCDVTCDGPGSCRGVTCGESCRCDVDCVGDQSCSTSVICSQEICDSIDGGCDSTNATQCNTCPGTAAR